MRKTLGGEIGACFSRQRRATRDISIIFGLLARCEAGGAELLNSAALSFEVDHNPHSARKSFVQETLSGCRLVVRASQPVEQRARTYRSQGIKPLDALHLACAVEGQADYFCTCDDRFLRRATQLDTQCH